MKKCGFFIVKMIIFIIPQLFFIGKNNMNKSNLIEIKNDVFDIVQAIKAIDCRYKVFYNSIKSRFELYSQKGMNLVLELICPYKNLDVRFLNKVKISRVENAKKIIEEMEKNNQKLLDNQQKKILQESQYKAREMIEYADKKSVDIDFSMAYQNQWY